MSYRRRALPIERLEHTASLALLGGYGHVATWSDDTPWRPYNWPKDPLAGRQRRLVRIRCAMDCTDPHVIELYSNMPARHGAKKRPLTLVVESRCRKCEPCRRRRSLFWQGRAVDEWTAAKRSLFGTLTLHPDFDYKIDAEARVGLSKRGVDFDRLDEGEKFRARVKYGGRYVTLWLKRLREGTAGRDKPKFRYLLVAEQHNSAKTSDLKRGRPHWHVILHETSDGGLLVLPHEWAVDKNGQAITDKYGNALVHDRAFLKAQWTYGHSSFAHCATPRAAAYCCKYLTKEEAQVRIRASGQYGTPPGTIVNVACEESEAANAKRLNRLPQEGDTREMSETNRGV